MIPAKEKVKCDFESAKFKKINCAKMKNLFGDVRL